MNRSLLSRTLIALFIIALAAPDCASIVGFKDYEPTGAGGTGGGGGSSSGSGASGGGSGGAASQATGAVTGSSSSSGGCSMDPPDTTLGDCQKPACMSGVVVIVVDNNDLPSPMAGGCKVGVCSGGMPGYVNAPDAQPCLAGGTGGECCKGACMMGLGQICNDTCKDGGESDVDCGGNYCPKCVTGKKCSVPTDCITMMCDVFTHVCT